MGDGFQGQGHPQSLELLGICVAADFAAHFVTILCEERFTEAYGRVSERVELGFVGISMAYIDPDPTDAAQATQTFSWDLATHTVQ